MSLYKVLMKRIWIVHNLNEVLIYDDYMYDRHNYYK